MDNTNVPATSQDSVNDTSSAFEPPAQSPVNNEVSIDDIILGNVEETAPAFEAPVAPEVHEQPSMEQPIDAESNNDATRYQYWQSRASKLENQMDGMRDQQNQLMANQLQAPAPAQPEAPVQETFPDAPAKPEKPRNYSREEAYSDPQSESAQYLDNVDEWRDSTEEYNQLRNQYDMAVMQEKIDGEKTLRTDAERQRNAQRAEYEQKTEISSHVQQKYNMGNEEAGAFIKQMSSPDSLTMDNLVQLWRLQRGSGAPQNASAQSEPSAVFQQTQRAQQIPSPMGVMPGSSNQAQGSTEDQIMSGMITDFNSKNPWK